MVTQTMLWDPAAHYGPDHWGVCVPPMSEEPLTIDYEEVGIVDHFCYLSEMLCCEGGAERAVKIRTAAA